MSARLVTELRIEARYRHERLDRYKGRMYGGRGASAFKLRELKRGCDRVEARLRRAEESYERSHGARRVVLDKLRYMRTSEPLPGYDTLAGR